MIPKEKAIELVDKFMDYSEHRFNINNDLSPVYTAKQCALIAVDEIIKERYFHIDHYTQSNLKYHIELELSSRLQATRIYWEEVKHEINNL